MIIHLPWSDTPLTEEQSNFLFMFTFKDDVEDAPWMVMGTLQFGATSDLFQSLRDYVERQGLPWTVAAMHPILYRWPHITGKKQLAPDLFVAFTPNHPRTSFDLDVEGDFPPFIVEVVSPSSSKRDQVEKLDAYDMLKVREYVLFTPKANRRSTLAGYHRAENGQLEPWPLDERGRLWSKEIGLYLVVQGHTLRAATRDGQFLPTLAEAIDAREREAAARERESAAREREAEELRAAEARLRDAQAENERLRRELDQLRWSDP